MTFRDDVRRDFAAFIEARDAFTAALVKELRLEWLLAHLERAIRRVGMRRVIVAMAVVALVALWLSLR
jgi:hypothetical protein